VKDVEAAALQVAVSAGLDQLGENRVQEALAHRAALGPDADRVGWHLIGHLQTNKASAAAAVFDIIESVDSLRLAEQLAKRTTQRLRVLLEVNVAGEVSKSGFAPIEVSAAVSAVRRLTQLELAGLMTVAPATADSEQVRPVFRELRRLAQQHDLPELSMGMTDDFEVAIEEGATIVRLGRAIFGERPR
jgi:pyridoxal phosphate enzyme (YggS family)